MHQGNPVVIAGVGMTPFGKHEDKTLGELARSAMEAALQDAAFDPDEIDLVVSANSMGGLLQDMESVRGQAILKGSRLVGRPLINVENACASSTSALQVACWALLSGQSKAAVVLGVEKLFHPDKAATFRALASASDHKAAGPGRSLFMDFYASRARHHMQEFGTTALQLAEVSAKNRRHGLHNPNAQFQAAASAEEVLASKMIVEPLTLLMCSPISDGAAALVLTREDLVSATRPVVGVRGMAMNSGDSVGPDFKTIQKTAQLAFKNASITSRDIDVAEVHDATAVAEIEACEALGLAKRGEGGALAASGETCIGGRVPVNPSGGLCSRGHPVAATGLAQICELTWQLRGECGARQVEGAAIGVAENHGGLIGDDVAVSMVTVLERLS